MTSPKNTITAIKAFNDNYIWAVTTDSCQNVALVDPGDAKACIDFIEEHELSLTSILITHHHKDHTGGIQKLVNYAKDHTDTLVTVYGPANENISGITHKVHENDTVYLGDLGYTFSVLALPGHTLDHIAYANDDVLFCGDTLFSGGCGRLFEGTAEQMYTSIAKLKALSNDTLVYCAHEYTQANLTFALAVEPNNKALQQYQQQVTIQRQQDISTIPSTMALEKQINPFLRCHIDAVADSVNTLRVDKIAQSKQTFDIKDIAVFSALREWKNNF